MVALAQPQSPSRPRRRMWRPKSDLPRSTWARSGYRFYSPKLGRWVNRDPLSEQGSMFLLTHEKASDSTQHQGLGNSYVAFDNCPITRVDGVGLETHLFPINGEVYNISSARIHGRGDYRTMNYSLLGGLITWQLRPYSDVQFWLGMVTPPGYTGYVDSGWPLTRFTLGPLMSTRLAYELGISPVVDADVVDDASRGGESVQIYFDLLCCSAEEKPIWQPKGMNLTFIDCPLLSSDPTGVIALRSP